jgi:acyl carrier protein phosphodiesterase
MNYLAHAYLSFNHPEILVGNMISDFVKGKKKFDYIPGIQKGIELHRAIDTFTDFHPATKEAKVYLQPAVGAYAGAFIDVVYDHFLANDAAQFAPENLAQTAAGTYSVLNQYLPHLPPNFQTMLPYMETQNWLANYASLQGIEKSFGGVARRAAYLNSSSEVFRLFRQHYLTLQKCYNVFFPDVKAYAASYLQTLLNK